MKLIITGSILTIFLAFVAASNSVVIPVNPQRVSIFYDVTSQDNYKFMTDQLYPTYNRCGGPGNSLMDVEYIPCGENVTTTRERDGALHFYCGPDNQKDCESVIMHSCALKHLPKELVPSFVDLSAKQLFQGTPSLDAARVALEGLNLGLASEALVNLIRRCMETQEGPTLVEVNESEAIRRLGRQAVQTGTPCIMFNGQYNPEESKQCEQNFMQELCTKLGIPDLALCSRVMEQSRAESRTNKWRSAIQPEATTPRFTLPTVPSRIMTLPTVPPRYMNLPTVPSRFFTLPTSSYVNIICGECQGGYVRQFVSDGVHCGRCMPGSLTNQPSNPCGPGQYWSPQFGCQRSNVEWMTPRRRYCPGCYCTGPGCPCDQCRYQTLQYEGGQQRRMNGVLGQGRGYQGNFYG